MDSEGRGSGSPAGGESSDNVVAFTGGWYGPADELVPIGRPTADPAVAGGPVDDPLDAGDFWGEASASLHEAVAAPVPSPVSPPAGPAVVEPRSTRRGPDVSFAPVPRPRRAPGGRLAAAMAAAVAVPLVGLALLGGGSGPGVHRGAVPLGSGLAANLTRQDDRVLALTAEAIDHVGSDRSLARHSSPRLHFARRGARAQRDARRRAVAAGAVRSRASTAGAQVSTGAIASYAEPPTTSSAPVRDGSSRAGSAPPSSPNPASLLGPGHCACE